MLTAKSELRGLELSRLMDINRGARQMHQLYLEGAKTHIKPYSLTPPCGLTGSTAKITSQHLVLSPYSLLVPWWRFIPTAKPCSISLHRSQWTPPAPRWRKPNHAVTTLIPSSPAQREQMFSKTLPCATCNTIKTVLFLVFVILWRQHKLESFILNF